ncbi:hypothetical protein MD484_g7537, partial [Candolleomyces efflorescens]
MVLCNPSTRVPYTGTRRRLVLAFDVGTTYSGISYSILDPGQVPEIRGVARFPANEYISGASKIPTVMYYDEKGNVRAAGAEAIQDGMLETALDRGWMKIEWFKLLIRPKSGGPELSDKIPPLPPGKSVVRVLADFLQYLQTCAEAYIKVSHASGQELWDSVSSEIHYVISHPNGWEGYQQSQIRKAVVRAQLIPHTIEGHARVLFVTEGEASLHFTIDNGLPAGVIDEGEGIVVVDAGGGTIDISAYTKKAGCAPYTFEEITIPQCHFFGSVFVTINARLFIDDYLKGSEYHEELENIVRCFDRSTKIRFNNNQQPQFIRFGGTRDHDHAYNIRFGQLRLSGIDVAKFFEPSVKCVTDAVLDVAANARKPIKVRSAPYIMRFQKPDIVQHVVLVGGFSASDWLVSNVRQVLGQKGLNVVIPDNYINKAVSDGAVSFYLDQRVKTRISKVAYGPIYCTRYNPALAAHRARRSLVLTRRDGSKRLPGRFNPILPKNTPISEGQSFSIDLTKRPRTSGSSLKPVCELWCYVGQDPNPQWEDEDPGNFRLLCKLQADAAFLRHSQPRRNEDGTDGEHWTFDFTLVLWFSATELRAQLVWEEDGVEKQGPATIVYEPNDI